MPVQEIHARHFERSAILSGYQVPKAIPAIDVIRVLNKAKVPFVLVGAYGLAGWRKEPRATEDVDVVVAAKQVKKAVRILLQAFPDLEEVDLPVVTRLRARGTEYVALDVMKPVQQPYREVFKNTHSVTSEGQTYRVPSLEMAIVMKFSAMVSLYRAAEDKYQDAHDFILMVKNNPNYDKEKLAALASLIYEAGGKDALELARKAAAGEMLNLQIALIMAKTRILVQRRKAIRNIRKITRTMELIATARFKKAMDRASEAEAYTRKIAELAADLSASSSEIKHPLLEKREQVTNSLLLVITSNRGLCGGYNASILREATRRIREIQAEGVTLHLELSGKRAIAYYRYQGINAEKKFTHFEDKPRFDEVEELADRYLSAYIAGKIDRVEVCYMKFLNAARQTPVVETLLPLSAVPGSDRRAPTAARPVEYEFLPSARDILEVILPVSFKVRLFKCFLDAAVSEQIARRVAMKSATENAGDMIKMLTRQYNRARQAQITKEIAEVIGGAEALR